MRASQMRTFRAVTLPLMLPGLANGWLVMFVGSLAGFGHPIVLGGSFGVLSAEIFFAVVGAQQDFGRAAVLAAIMLVVALTAMRAARLRPRSVGRATNRLPAVEGKLGAGRHA
ncbi:hypothetical protein [Falsiroseomonas sp. E2-1-a20]|uniref:hypothetical protein n=1 Tax=Falsiroseomonas sp. E2-1-a20 TaxID=3239300 RepID=UPI003F37E64F